jgi:hypothetical protein
VIGEHAFALSLYNGRRHDGDSEVCMESPSDRCIARPDMILEQASTMIHKWHKYGTHEVHQ